MRHREVWTKIISTKSQYLQSEQKPGACRFVVTCCNSPTILHRKIIIDDFLAGKLLRRREKQIEKKLRRIGTSRTILIKTLVNIFETGGILK